MKFESTGGVAEMEPPKKANNNETKSLRKRSALEEIKEARAKSKEMTSEEAYEKMQELLERMKNEASEQLETIVKVSEQLLEEQRGVRQEVKKKKQASEEPEMKKAA